MCKSVFLTFLMGIGGLCRIASGEIIPVDQLSSMEHKLLQLDQDALVLFDVDYTLLIQDDAILQPRGEKLVKKFIREILENPSLVPPEKYPGGYLHAQVAQQATFSLLDVRFPELVKRLQDRKIPTIAFTGAPAGKLGLIPSMADKRIEELKQLGFDFTSAFPKTHFLEFLKRSDKEFVPLFKSGVLFSSKHPKGDVLKQFLDTMCWYPKEVVLVDDRMEYLQSVENVLYEMRIPFTGFHYTAAEKLPSELDEKTAEFQFRYLAEFGEWLCDQEVKDKLRYAQIFRLEELLDELKEADEQTLVVFDVDEVLITTEDHFIHPYADDIFIPLVQGELAKANSPEAKKELEKKLSLCMLLPKRLLIEEETPAFIKNLQKKNIKTMALTSCQTGPFGMIPKVERWRIDCLQVLNVSFASSFPALKRHSFTEMALSGRAAPLFEEGILFSKGYQKGEVLKAFLKHAQFSPTKILFIDDLQENLDSVKAAVASLNIDFKGCQYNGAKRFFKKTDPAVLNYQFDHLMQHEEWLSDTEVRKRLKEEL